MPDFNNIRKMFGMPEKDPSEVEDEDQKPKLSGLALMNQAVKDSLAGPAPTGLSDIKQMAMNPTPAQQQLGEQVTQGVGGSIGSIQGPARGMSSAFKNKAAQEKYLKDLSEFAPAAKTHTPEKVGKLRELFDQISQREGITPQKKMELLKKLQAEERLTEVRGYKLPKVEE